MNELTRIGEAVVEAARRAGADVAEASVREGSHLSAKVRMLETELVEEAGSRSLGLRVMLGQQVAVTYTSDFTEVGRARLIEDAIELAKLSQPDPFAGPPDPSLLSKSEEHEDLDLYDASLGSIGAGDAIERAKRGEKAALDFDARITNSEGSTFTRTQGASALVTSGGFSGAVRGSYGSLVVSPVVDEEGGKKRSGYHWSARRHLGEIDDPASVGEEAARRTLRKLGAGPIESAEMPVVFDPDVGRSILGLLASCVNGSSIWRRSSYLVDRLETKVASHLVNVIDDPLIERAPGSRPFDGEGLVCRRNRVVEEGVLKTYLLDTYAAKKLEMATTASAGRGASGGVGPTTSNFILQPGKTTAAEILASTERGLYVTEMMGFGFNATTGDFSRGAAGFLIEGGELGQPVSEVTISLNIDELLKRIDAVGDDLDLRTSTATPTFRVSAMTVAGR